MTVFKITRSACRAIVMILLASALLGSVPAAGQGGQIHLFPPGTTVKNPPVPRSNAEFVGSVYRDFLGREPSAREKQGWVGKLNEGFSRQEMILQLSASDEAFVRQTFRNVIGRDPYPDEADNMLRALRGGRDRKDVVDALLNSGEYMRKFRPGSGGRGAPVKP